MLETVSSLPLVDQLAASVAVETRRKQVRDAAAKAEQERAFDALADVENALDDILTAIKKTLHKYHPDFRNVLVEVDASQWNVIPRRLDAFEGQKIEFDGPSGFVHSVLFRGGYLSSSPESRGGNGKHAKAFYWIDVDGEQ